MALAAHSPNWRQSCPGIEGPEESAVAKGATRSALLFRCLCFNSAEFSQVGKSAWGWTSLFLLLHNSIATRDNTASTLTNTAAMTEEGRTGARVSGIAKHIFKTYLEKPLAFVGSVIAGYNIYVSTASMSDFLGC